MCIEWFFPVACAAVAVPRTKGSENLVRIWSKLLCIGCMVLKMLSIRVIHRRHENTARTPSSTDNAPSISEMSLVYDAIIGCHLNLIPHFDYFGEHLKHSCSIGWNMLSMLFWRAHNVQNLLLKNGACWWELDGEDYANDTTTYAKIECFDKSCLLNQTSVKFETVWWRG